MAKKPAAPQVAQKANGRTTKNSLKGLQQADKSKLYWKSRAVRNEYARRKRLVPKKPKSKKCNRPKTSRPFMACRDRKKMQIECIFIDGLWETVFRCDPSHKKCNSRGRTFHSKTQAHTDFRKGIELAESLSDVTLYLEKNSKNIPIFWNKLEPGATVYLKCSGDDGSMFDVFNPVLSQIDKDLEIYVTLNSSKKCMLDNKLLKMEENYSFRFASFNGLVNDAQLLELRGDEFYFKNSSVISPNGFVNFIQKVLKADSSADYRFRQTSSEFESWFFEQRYYNNQATLRLKMCALKNAELVVCFTRGTIDVKTSIGRNRETLNTNNAAMLEQYPKLKTFLAHVSGGLPPNFELLV